MREGDIAVPARYYLRLAELLSRQNIDSRFLFSKAGINPATVEAPDAQLRFSQVERLVELAGELSGRTDLGMELGRTLTASTHSLVGFGMLNSPNLEHSLRFVARFFRLVMPSFSMRFVKLPQGADLIWVPAVGMSKLCLTFHIEAIATAAYREVLELSGGALPPFRAELSIAEPPHRGRYRELDRARWSFGVGDQPAIHLRFDHDLSQYPLATADTNALRVAEERCRALVSSVAAEGNFKDWTTMMLREAGDGLPSLVDLAEALNLSPRTLDRYLKREGTGFRELAAQVQHELACEKLRRPRSSITEIAHSLGFHNAANFTRAFKARSGCSPREFRERSRG